MFDYQQGCTYDSEEFLVSASGCRLWLTLTQAPEANETVNTTAAVETNQECELSVAGGVVLQPTGNSLTFANGMVNLVLTGTVAFDGGTTDAGMAASPDAFQWSFQAPGAAP